MTDIDAALQDSDGLKWFNRLYLRVTEAVRSVRRCKAEIWRQHALAGMNAHINRDLPLALVQKWAARPRMPARVAQISIV